MRSPDLLRSAPARKAGAARREGRGDSRMRRNTHTHKRRHNPADERRPRFDENHANARVGAVRVRIYIRWNAHLHRPFFERTEPPRPMLASFANKDTKQSHPDPSEMSTL